MRASVFIGPSLDGFIARPDGALDRLPSGGGEPHGYDEFIATGAKPVFVLSTRELASAPAGAVVEQMSGDPLEIVLRLGRRGRVPVLIGKGIPLFGALERDIVLEHIGTRPFSSGLVQSEYRIGE